ncbi:hypothetical protein QWY93_15270 [Echinicola jeungdonensis]|uniref:NnrS protein n=1 Tax=Echinicola jeungdonensis TaxID=709343 RepID=A0ABV5J340_9BACT|nr:hypothetical protein [Echinicola jeungdonensis]MDN3670683.1 hypothetical protein [Echinicola jeungdonensis]
MENYILKSTWVSISLINFFIAALMGLLLRSAFVWEFNWLEYRNMLHAHSHLAMLGWVYLILFSLLIDYFVPEEKKQKPFYNRLFWGTQFAVFGMMVSFPIQGYGLFSISFSCLHILASYLFVFRFWKDMTLSDPQVKLLIKSSLVFLLISTLGLWALGLVMVSLGKISPLYQVTIQFFLHFQFNGWFTLGVFALVLNSLKKHGFELRSKIFNRVFRLLLAGILLTFAHVLDWAYPNRIFYIINGIGVIFQLMAFVFLLGKGVRKYSLEKSNFLELPNLLLVFGLVSWAFKIIVQAFLIFPAVSEISTLIRNFMIGYIHLTMLGFVTGLIFWCLAIKKDRNYQPSGIYLFIIGFLGTELILFVQGGFYWMGWGMLPFYHEALVGFSLLLPLGIIKAWFIFSRKNPAMVANHIIS